MPIKTEIRLTNPWVNTWIKIIISAVTKPKIKLLALPKCGSATLPPPIFWKATGINVKPIKVISDPVTTTGKNLRSRAKSPLIKKTKIPAAMTPPYMYPQPKVFPMCSIGAKYSTAEPSTTGKAIPVSGVRLICKKVAIPHIKMSTEIK